MDMDMGSMRDLKACQPATHATHAASATKVHTPTKAKLPKSGTGLPESIKITFVDKTTPEAKPDSASLDLKRARLVFKRAQRYRRSLATGTDRRISLAKRVAEQMGCHYMHALTEMGERRTNPYKKAADKIKTELTEKLFGEGSLVDPDK
jgi:hypothetical protein